MISTNKEIKPTTVSGYDLKEYFYSQKEFYQGKLIDADVDYHLAIIQQGYSYEYRHKFLQPLIRKGRLKRSYVLQSGDFELFWKPVQEENFQSSVNQNVNTELLLKYDRERQEKLEKSEKIRIKEEKIQKEKEKVFNDIETWYNKAIENQQNKKHCSIFHLDKKAGLVVIKIPGYTPKGSFKRLPGKYLLMNPVIHKSIDEYLEKKEGNISRSKIREWIESYS